MGIKKLYITVVIHKKKVHYGNEIMTIVLKIMPMCKDENTPI